MERNAQTGLPAERCQELRRISSAFDAEVDPRSGSLNFVPRAEGLNSTEVMELLLEFTVPPSLYQLQGHFESQPIVPGYLILSWFMTTIESCLVLPAPAATNGNQEGLHKRASFGTLHCARVTGLKFISPILPGELCQVRISAREHKNESGASQQGGAETCLFSAECSARPGAGSDGASVSRWRAVSQATLRYECAGELK